MLLFRRLCEQCRPLWPVGLPRPSWQGRPSLTPRKAQVAKAHTRVQLCSVRSGSTVCPVSVAAKWPRTCQKLALAGDRLSPSLADGVLRDLPSGAQVRVWYLRGGAALWRCKVHLYTSFRSNCAGVFGC